MFMEGKVTVHVADLDRALRFYTATLGLRLRYRAGDDWAEVMAPGLTIGLQPHGGLRAHPAAAPCHAQPPLSIGFTVAHLEPARDLLAARGVKFCPEIDEDETIRTVTFCDPDGNALYLCELRREAR
ncbi:MAG TPA: VOC family protein [Polyangia bacterium]|jgi:catechol 2,3-dioxygenase-like lactoylglutathione lyase family enzyme